MWDKVTDQLILNYGLGGALLVMNAILVVFVGRWMMLLIKQQRADFLSALKLQRTDFLAALRQMREAEQPAASDDH